MLPILLLLMHGLQEVVMDCNGKPFFKTQDNSLEYLCNPR